MSDISSQPKLSYTTAASLVSVAEEAMNLRAGYVRLISTIERLSDDDKTADESRLFAIDREAKALLEAAESMTDACKALRFDLRCKKSADT